MFGKPTRRRVFRGVAIAAIVMAIAAPSSTIAQETAPVMGPAPTEPPAPPAAVEPITPPAEVPRQAAPVAPAEGRVPPTPGAAVGPAKGPVDAVVKELRRGPLLIHGNYCGIGNRPGKPPVDALDAACMRHDACTVTGKLPSCACDDRLRVEATAIANDPRTPVDVKTIAAATAASMAVLVCKIAPRS